MLSGLSPETLTVAVNLQENTGSMTEEIIRVLDEVLGLGARAAQLTPESPLLGAVPEFDSMAVVAVLTALEEAYGIAVEDDEIDASIFESVATLSAYVGSKLG